MNVHKPNAASEFPSEVSPHHEERLNDKQRLDALARVDVMDTPREEGFDRVARLATRFLDVPVGIASFVDAERQFFKAQCGLTSPVAADRQTPLSHSFCQYVVTHDRTLAVNDARSHPVLNANGAISDLGVVAYLGVPIHAPGGEAIGSFCAIDTEPRMWSESDVEILTDLAAMIETELHLRQERDSMQTLAREMNHRVKNLFSVVGGMIALTSRSAESPADMARVLQGRLSALDLAHSIVSPSLADGRLDAQSLALGDLIDRLLQPHVATGRDQVSLDLPALRLSGRAVTDLALVIHELATNAAKYGALSNPDGSVAIAGVVDGGTFRLTWRETGGPRIAAPPSETGFGTTLIDVTVSRQMGGALDTTWHPGGVAYTLSLPRSVFDAAEDASDAPAA